MNFEKSFADALKRVWSTAKKEASTYDNLEDWWEEERDPTSSEVEAFLKKQFDAFMADFKKHAVISSRGIKGYRFISGIDLHNKELNLQNVGIYWAYSKLGSENYRKAWPTHEKDILLEAEIPWSSLDFEATLIMGLHPAARHVEEKELRLKRGQPLILTKINDKKTKQKVEAESFSSLIKRKSI